MKFKKIMLLIIIAVTIFVLSGCANITCSFNLKENGEIDVNASVLYSDKEFSYDNEAITKIKEELSYEGFLVEDINENGMLGFSISKEDVDLKSIISIIEEKFGIKVKKDFNDAFKYEKGFLYNKYDIDFDIDLTDIAKEYPLYEKDNKSIGGEELQKILSHLSLKLIVSMDSGVITETNSKLLSEDKKTAEWVLIPGTDLDIELEAITTSPINIVGTIVVIGVVLILALVIMIILIKLYRKRKKECSE